MKIGIIVYSKTGHTLSVAKKIEGRLVSLGHFPSLYCLGQEMPNLEEFEGLLICSSVQGGMPPMEMKEYLAGISSLEGKKVACLVTGFFPAAGGRNQTLAYLKRICEGKGATICGLSSVGWKSFNRNNQIARVVEEMSNCF